MTTSTSESEFIIEQKSFSGNGIYFIHTGELTCSCQDFIKNRKYFKIGDPRRFCKHLIHVLLNSSTMPEWAKQYRMKFQTLDESRKGFPRDKYPTLLSLNDVEVEIWLPDYETGERPPGPWCDIYISGERYSYNYKEWRWSSDNEPPQHREIIESINKELRQPSIPDAIPKNGIITAQRKNGMCRGKFGVVDFFVVINPRANWQNVAMGKNHAGIVNVKERRCMLNPALKHIEEPIMEWVIDEFNAVKAESVTAKKMKSKKASKVRSEKNT